MAARPPRDVRRYRRRILTVGIVALGLTYVIGAPFFVDRVESDLERRVPEELVAAGFDGVSAVFDGQDGTISCTSPLADPEAARQAAYDVWGVRAIDLDRSCRVNSDATEAAASGGSVPEDAAGGPATTDVPASASTEGSTPPTTETAAEPAFDTVADVLSGSPQLSLFAVLVQEAGLTAELSDPEAGPVTVFAPTDEAFEVLPADVLADLRADPEALRHVLMHHMTAGMLLAADFATGPLTMRDGAVVDLDAAVPAIGDAEIVVADLEAATGVVHMIDRVLATDELDVVPTPPAASVGAMYEEGTITLAGVVATEAVRATLRDAATADGVTVDDQLTVDPDSGLDAVTAADLAGLITALRTHLIAGAAGFDGEALYLAGTYASDTDRDAVAAAADAVGVSAELTAPPEATQDDAVDLETELNDYVAANPILFEASSASISPESAAVLDRLAALARQFDGVSITVQGHTDSDGDPHDNQVLSEARAYAVRQALIDRGLPASSLRYEGFGSSQPILVDGVEDKAASRRVEFRVEAVS